MIFFDIVQGNYKFNIKLSLTKVEIFLRKKTKDMMIEELLNHFNQAGEVHLKHNSLLGFKAI